VHDYEAQARAHLGRPDLPGSEDLVRQLGRDRDWAFLLKLVKGTGWVQVLGQVDPRFAPLSSTAECARTLLPADATLAAFLELLRPGTEGLVVRRARRLRFLGSLLGKPQLRELFRTHFPRLPVTATTKSGLLEVLHDLVGDHDRFVDLLEYLRTHCPTDQALPASRLRRSLVGLLGAPRVRALALAAIHGAGG
jgi:hypothetical protein